MSRERKYYRCRGCLERVWPLTNEGLKFQHHETHHQRKNIEYGYDWFDVHSDDVVFDLYMVGAYDCNWICSYEEVFPTSC